MAVARAVSATGKVQPADTRATVLEEQLVEVQVIHDVLIPAAPRLYIRQVDVGSLTTQVLRIPHSMHRLVQLLASVATIDMYRLALMVAQGLLSINSFSRKFSDNCISGLYFGLFIIKKSCVLVNLGALGAVGRINIKSLCVRMRICTQEVLENLCPIRPICPLSHLIAHRTHLLCRASYSNIASDTM